ncbi:MAG: glycosyltransferase family 2 protein [Pseudohongiellaceae bacterium]
MQNNRISACAIIVTYNPAPEGLLALVQQISRQCDFLVIDNASANSATFIAQVRASARCVGVQQLDSNIGLASALNAGLQQVRQAGYGFAVLFDQDSQVPVSFFANLQTAYVEAVGLCGQRIAAIGPRIRHPANGREMPFKLFTRLFRRTDIKLPGSDRLYRADFLISSGCLLALEHFDEIGPMKDSYFIDNVDLEWCFRARDKGFLVLGTDHTHLLHSIGEDTDNALVRAGVMISHSPLRSYYSTRNRVHLWRQSYAPLGWKLRDIPRFALKALWLLLFSPQRAQYWENIRDGIADARGLE